MGEMGIVMVEHTPGVHDPIYGPSLDDMAAREKFAEEAKARHNPPDWYAVYDMETDTAVAVGEDKDAMEAEYHSFRKDASDPERYQWGWGYDAIEERPAVKEDSR